MVILSALTLVCMHAYPHPAFLNIITNSQQFIYATKTDSSAIYVQIYWGSNKTKRLLNKVSCLLFD